MPTIQSPSSSTTSPPTSSDNPSTSTTPLRPPTSRVASSAPHKRLRVEDIDELLQQIPPDFLRSKDFNPFTHYDDGVEELQGYHDVIKEAIDLIVDVHAKGFNSATAAFSHVVDSFASSQATVSTLLTTLHDSRRLLTSRSEHLKEYWTQTATLTAIQQTLAKLSYIMTLPAHLQTLSSHHLHLHSTILLTHTLTLLSDDDLRDIEGLLDLREQFLTLKHTTHTNLIDLAHTAIYHTPQRHHDIAAQQGGNKDAGGAGAVSGTGSPLAPTPTHPSNGELAPSSQGEGGTAGSAPTSSPPASAAATLSFLLSSEFSPFSPASSYLVDPASLLPPDSAVFTDPAYRSLLHLLAEERSPSYQSSPLSSTPRFLSHLTAALDHLHALPAAKTQLVRRVRAEVTAIIEREKSALRDRLKAGAGRHRGQGGRWEGPSDRPCCAYRSRGRAAATGVGGGWGAAVRLPRAAVPPAAVGAAPPRGAHPPHQPAPDHTRGGCGGADARGRRRGRGRGREGWEREGGSCGGGCARA